MREIRTLVEADDATFHLMAPTPEAKDAFAEWISRPENRTRENYAAFEGVLAGLRELLRPQSATPAEASNPRPTRDNGRHARGA